MNARRFPTLTVARVTGIDDWSGMIPLHDFDLRMVCDDDLIPGTRASVLLRDEITDLLAQAKDIARAVLGFDGPIRAGPYFSALPKLPGTASQLIVGWRAGGGISFIAATLPLLHLHQDDSEYAGYNSHGRIVHLGTCREAIATSQELIKPRSTCLGF